MNKVVADNIVNRAKKVEFDLDFPEVEMEWLFLSARGILKEGVCLSTVSKRLSKDGYDCQVSPLDSFSALLTFESKEAM